VTSYASASQSCASTLAVIRQNIIAALFVKAISDGLTFACRASLCSAIAADMRA